MKPTPAEKPGSVLLNFEIESAVAQEAIEVIEPQIRAPFVYKTYEKIDHLRYMKKKVIKAEKLNEFMDLYKSNYLS